MVAKKHNKRFCCCALCGEEISTNNLDKHYNSKLCQKGGKFTTVHAELNYCPHCKTPKEQIQGQFENHVRWCDETLKKRNI